MSWAADVLFVADATTDTNIADVLEGDGHSVTVVTGDYAGDTNPELTALSPGDYDAVVWVAAGDGYGDAHDNAALFDALVEFVESGGRVFVTGYDSIASPSDPLLVDFVGGNSSHDGADTPGPVIDEENSLTVGIVDIRGVVPSGYYSDRDSVVGLQVGTVGVVSSGSDWQWTLRELGAGEVAYVSNGTSSGSHTSWTDTSAGGAGAYNAAVRNFVSGAAMGAPRLRWVEDQVFEVPEGGELTLTVTVEDREGDPTTTGWDLDADGSYDDAEEESVVVSAAGMDGPDTIAIGVESCDDVGNCSHRDIDIDVLNAPPVLTSPTEVDVLVDQEFTYQPEVSDPGGDHVDIEVLDRPAGMVLLAEGGVRWTPRLEDVGDHALTFIATDDDDDPDVEGDGDAVLVVTITVLANQPPSETPDIVSPERGADVAEIRPTFVVGNPTDPEGDALFISFEVAETDTFVNPIASGPQPAGSDGTTSWTITEDLENHTRYYWRVWATDENAAEGPRAFSYFRVEAPDGDAGVDGGAGDADVIDEPRIEGCGCGATRTPTGSAGAVLLILVSAFALARIRRP